MNELLLKKTEEAVWAAKSLFNRNKTSGSSANLSFLHEGIIYISAGGSCFGTLTADDFAPISLNGEPLSDKIPSKEWPLHLILYKKSKEIGAVLHTHSIYSVLWSFTQSENCTDCIPRHTPYLSMKLGTVGMIPYEKPGSKALFQAFEDRILKSDGYLLKQHGPVVPGKNMMDAFCRLEELEESARIAWELRNISL